MCPGRLSSCQRDVVCFVMASPWGNILLSPHSPDTHQGSPPECASSTSLCPFLVWGGPHSGPPLWFKGWLSSWFCWKQGSREPHPHRLALGLQSPGTGAQLCVLGAETCRLITAVGGNPFAPRPAENNQIL